MKLLNLILQVKDSDGKDIYVTRAASGEYVCHETLGEGGLPRGEVKDFFRAEAMKVFEDAEAAAKATAEFFSN